MALSWPSKAAGAVRRYEWTPKPDTALSSGSVSVASGTATATAEVVGDSLAVIVTGGAAGVVQQLNLSAIAGDETFTETVYLPIEETTNRLGYTVRDICLFALRKVAGIGEEPEAAEIQDAIERLNDRVALWRVTGADIGVSLPLSEGDTLDIPDYAYQALKLVLRNELHEFYGIALSQSDVMEARSALAVVKNAMIVRREPDYF